MNRNPNGDPRLRGEFPKVEPPTYPAREGPEVPDPEPEERAPIEWSRLGTAAISLLMAGAVLLLLWVLCHWAGGAW